MEEQSIFDTIALLQDAKVRQIWEYLLENKAASTLRISYALKMPPEDVERSLKQLEDKQLVRRETLGITSGTALSSDVYVLTEIGERIRKYLSRPPRQVRYK